MYSGGAIRTLLRRGTSVTQLVAARSGSAPGSLSSTCNHGRIAPALAPFHAYPSLPLTTSTPIRQRIPSCRQSLSSGARLKRSMTSESKTTFYDLQADLPKEGEVYKFSDLKGKVVLIVNVASKCGFTKQYTGLQELYDKFKDRDFIILGFPCNQFGGQEPGTDEDIASFCSLNHGVTFPLMKKSDVNGDDTNKVFQYLKEKKSGLLGIKKIKWNFEKFLIDKDGNVVERWASTTAPADIAPKVEKLLNVPTEEQTAKI